MEPGEFEKFMAEILKKSHQELGTYYPSFNSLGKPTKAKCDGYFFNRETDTYVAVIITTQQTDFVGKILTDIRKLEKVEFFEKIQGVIICQNIQMKDEIEIFREECRKYKWECEPIGLENVIDLVLDNKDIKAFSLRDIYPVSTEDAEMSQSPIVQSRRFECGPRLKQAREDISIRVSTLIEKIDFPSEREWREIEEGKLEAEERYLSAMSQCTGISTEWLKHETGVKYPVPTIYDNQTDIIRKIAADGFQSAYMAIDPENMLLLLVVKFSLWNWRFYSFGFTIDFWDWDGDSHHIPIIFELFKTINRELKNPYGRVISRKQYNIAVAGDTHPEIVFKEMGHTSHWFDDLIDAVKGPRFAKRDYISDEWLIKLINYFHMNKREG